MQVAIDEIHEQLCLDPIVQPSNGMDLMCQGFGPQSQLYYVTFV